MKASYNNIAVIGVVLLLVLACETEVSLAVTCTPTELSPCVNAITSGKTPSKLCCAKIKEQKPCLCQYIRNPNLKKFVTSPNAKKVAYTCRVPIPKC